MTSRESQTTAAGSTIDRDPGSTTPAALYQEALDHLRAGRFLEAQLCGTRALEADAGHADSLHLMGVLSLQAGHDDLAVEWMARAIRQDPRPDFLSNLGIVLRRLGRTEEALKALDKAVQLKPDDAELWKQLADTLAAAKRATDAILGYQHALRLAPGHQDAARRCAILLDQLGRFDEALALLDLCKRLQPDNVSTLRLRAMTLLNLKRFEEALVDNVRAHALEPSFAETCNNIGAALQSLCRDNEALPWFDRALALQADFVAALINKAAALGQAHRFDEAAAIYEHLKTLETDNAEAEWNLALLHLLTGDFAAGWQEREARWRARPVDYPDYSQPMWLGQESVAGKTVMVRADEGLGDSIQFVRYVPLLAARGARVVLVVQEPLCSLLSAVPGVAQCLPRSAETLPAFDLHCPICSLPLAFGTLLGSMPSAADYLPPIEPARLQSWEDRLGPRTRTRVGLVWSGNPDHKNDHNRSMALRALTPLFKLDATFVSLQKHPRAADAASLRQHDIIDLTADLTDFAETAALVSCLDLVVTVDTGVAHLAAALGRPTWIMLPYTPDYRWLLDRNDSPWYPTARLFRQGATRDWTVVVDRVRTALSELLQQRQPPAANDERAPEADSAATLYRAAVQHLRAGRSAEAERCCAHALKLDAGHADSLHLMGVLSLQAGHDDLAVEWMAGAIRQNPKPEFLSNLGAALRRLGRTEEALKALDKAVQLDPGDAGLWKTLGDILAELERPADAVLSYQRALALDPQQWDAAQRCATLLDRLGRLEEQVACLDHCDDLEPNHVDTLRRRATALYRLKRFDEALADYLRAHALDPADGNTCNDIGATLTGLRRDAEALTWFAWALALRTPELRGGVPKTLDDVAACFAAIRQVGACAPANADTSNNIGDALVRLGREEESLRWFDLAVELRPGTVLTLTGKARALARLRRRDEAVAAYEHIKRIDPGSADADFGLAHLHLMFGEFEAGWALREARWRLPGLRIVAPEFSAPAWLGEQSVAGRTILLYADEGMGDVIQFARYVPLLAERGAKVLLAAHDALRPLLSGLPGLSQYLSTLKGPLPAFDAYCPIMSLPLAFKTRLDTIPARTPYLPPAPLSSVQRWDQRLGPRRRLRVGLVWSGNPGHKDDHNRSIPLQLFTRLLDLDVTFISLQKELRPADAATLRDCPEIVDLTVHLTDFGETAAMIACLDLVITVDTSVAHLAGALGCPTWLLLSYWPDYRWMLDRDDSPWYPSMRLFRQDATRDWASVIDRVRAALCARLPAAETPPRPGADLAVAAAASRSVAQWHERGNSLMEQQRPADALQCYQEVLAIDPCDWDAACRSGILLQQLGRLDEAVACFDRCDALRPNHPATLYMRAVFLRELKRFEEALAGFERAHALEPANADTCNNAGTVLQALERHDAALTWFDRALALRPDFAEALYNKAVSLAKLGRGDEGFALYERLARLDRNDVASDWNLARLLAELDRPTEALVHFDRCVTQRPDHAPTLHLRAVMLNKLKRFEECLADGRRAHALDPANADTCNNIGAVLQRLGREEESLSWFDRALALRPDFALALGSKAVSLVRLHRFDEAEAAYARLKSIAPDDPLADFGLAHLRLLLGDFATGWSLREVRWRLPTLPIVFAKFAEPRWLGEEPVDGKTILLYADEGLGDVIQFARYVPLLAARGARVVLAIQDSLCPLLSGVAGVSQCVSILTGPLPPFDAYCPIMSLPLAFGTRLDTIPAETPYLPPPPQPRIENWEARLGPPTRLRVGLVWSGNPSHREDHTRSIPLRLLTRILDVDASFVSLQKDLRPADAETLRQRPDIIDLTAGLTDFVETAALVSCLDLVITVDTSVAHLAGALGRPTWLLLPFTPDYRWLLDRDDSPWYPSLRLFRQDATRDWASVLDRVRVALATRAATFGADPT